MIGEVEGELLGFIIFFCNIFFILCLVIFWWDIGNCFGGNLIGFVLLVLILWVVRFVWFNLLLGLIKMLEYCKRKFFSLFFLIIESLFDMFVSKDFKWFGKFEFIDILFWFCILEVLYLLFFRMYFIVCRLVIVLFLIKFILLLVGLSIEKIMDDFVILIRDLGMRILCFLFWLLFVFKMYVILFEILFLIFLVINILDLGGIWIFLEIWIFVYFWFKLFFLYNWILNFEDINIFL